MQGAEATNGAVRRVCILVIQTDDGSVLLGRDAHKAWSLPCAHIGGDELGPEAAGRRLAQELLGLPSNAKELRCQSVPTTGSEPQRTDSGYTLGQTDLLVVFSLQATGLGALHGVIHGLEAVAFHRPDELPASLGPASRKLALEWCNAPLHGDRASCGTASGTAGGTAGGAAGGATNGAADGWTTGGGWRRVRSAVAAGGLRVGEQVGSAGAASGARLRTGFGAAGDLAAAIVEREERLVTRVLPRFASYRRRNLGRVAETCNKAFEAEQRLQQKAGRHLKERHEISNAQHYFLNVAAAITLVCVALSLLRSCLSLMGRVEVVWWLMRTDQYDEFRVWTLDICKDPWQQETLLCEAARGSWLARELVRAKLATRDTDHCDPADPKGKGCRYAPCAAHPKGLAKALLGVADGWRSPLNNPTHKLYLALRPLRKPLRAVLHDLASGEISFSELDKIFTAFPFGEKIEAEGWLASRAAALKTKVMHTALYPTLRTWGLVIGGAPTPPAKRCAAPAPAPAPGTREESLPYWDDKGDGASDGVGFLAPNQSYSARRALFSGTLGLLREAHGVIGGLLQPPPPRLFANSREWRSAKLSKDGKRVSFILAGSKRPLSARAVECFTAGQREPPLAVQANEAAPLRPGQVVRVGVGRKGACFRNVDETARVVFNLG